MNQLTIMVDGGYYRKRAIYLWGKEISAVDRANELFNYCLLHLSEATEPRDLFESFIMIVLQWNETLFIR